MIKLSQQNSLVALNHRVVLPVRLMEETRAHTEWLLGQILVIHTTTFFKDDSKNKRYLFVADT